MTVGKPRIKVSPGIGWTCACPWVMACADTPLEAYALWLEASSYRGVN